MILKDKLFVFMNVVIVFGVIVIGVLIFLVIKVIVFFVYKKNGVELVI